MVLNRRLVANGAKSTNSANYGKRAARANGCFPGRNRRVGAPLWSGLSHQLEPLYERRAGVELPNGARSHARKAGAGCIKINVLR